MKLMRVNTRVEKRKKTKPLQHANFWDKICFSFCIFNKNKRTFLQLASLVIDNKLSVETILELSNNFELLKQKVLNEEEYKKFNDVPFLNFREQMKEFNIEDK